MKPPTIIKGQRIVRLRERTFDIGLGYGLRMWVVTDLDSRKPLGPNHLNRRNAARWVDDQGWRYIGSQEA